MLRTIVLKSRTSLSSKEIQAIGESWTTHSQKVISSELFTNVLDTVKLVQSSVKNYTGLNGNLFTINTYYPKIMLLLRLENGKFLLRSLNLQSNTQFKINLCNKIIFQVFKKNFA